MKNTNAISKAEKEYWKEMESDKNTKSTKMNVYKNTVVVDGESYVNIIYAPYYKIALLQQRIKVLKYKNQYSYRGHLKYSHTI